MKKYAILFCISLINALLPTVSYADWALAKSRNCTSCHTIERKIVGPAFQDIAARYRTDKAAAPRLANKIMNGGGGVWGVQKMPANHQVTDAEARQLADWILSLPSPVKP